MNEKTLVLTVLLTGSAVTDLRDGKVYNLWLVPPLFAGLSGLLCGAAPLSALAASVSVYVLLRPFFRMGAAGAGDVKLLMILALFFPPEEFCLCAAASFLAALPVCLCCVSACALTCRRPSGKKRAGETVLAKKLPFAVPTAAAFLLHFAGFF